MTPQLKAAATRAAARQAERTAFYEAMENKKTAGMLRNDIADLERQLERKRDRLAAAEAREAQS